MEKKFLTPEQARAMYILRRKRRFLTQRLQNKIGSEQALMHDKNELDSITIILSLIKENFAESQENGTISSEFDSCRNA